MFPTLSHLIEYITGVFIPLPFKTFGLFIALAFLAGSYFISKDLTQKNKSGVIPSSLKTVIKGRPTQPMEVIRTALIGLLIGFKAQSDCFFWNQFSEMELKSKDIEALKTSAEIRFP